MPTLSIFRVEFDRDGSTYAPGQVVSGRVIVELARPKSIRELRLSVKGASEVKWSYQKRVKDSQGRSQNRTDYFTAKEEYFYFLFPLLAPSNGESNVELPAGYNEYTFSFQLPHNIPCSFEHKYGHVRYTTKAVIDRPWRFDHECKSAFTVVSPLDLNTRLHECVGIDDEAHEDFCCFCCYNVGSIKVQIKIPSTGFVPGQTIHATLYFDNTSNDVRVTEVCTKLKQLLKFHATSPHRSTQTEKKTLEKNSNKGPFTSQETVISRIQIPSLPPSNLEFCNIIELNYQLDVTVHVSGLHCDITRTYPIVIGTIPLRIFPSAPNVTQVDPVNRPSAPLMNNQHVPMPMPMGSSMPTPTSPSARPNVPYPIDRPIGFVPQPSTSTPAWDMPPPSYEECMSMRTESIKDQDESNYVQGADTPFAPRYPVFTFPPPYKSP